MNLSAIDVNLFVVLQAVLAEGSATRAAARLHVTQSAVSNSLARLRRTLGDPLVVRTRRGLTPTPRALALKPRLDAALATLEQLVDTSSRFELATTTREWVMAFAEHHGTTLLPRLLARMRTRAPNATLRVITLDQLAQGDGLDTGEVDLHVGIPSQQPPGWRSEVLFEDELVCVLRKGHPAARGRMTVAAFAALPQVQARITQRRGREVDDALARRGLTRRIVLTVPYYSTIPAVVAATDCVAAVSRGQAVYYAKLLPIVIRELPLELPKLAIAMHWHARAERDPSVIALRALVREAG